MTKDERKAVLDALESSIRCKVLKPDRQDDLVSGTKKVMALLDHVYPAVLYNVVKDVGTNPNVVDRPAPDYEPCSECGFDHEYEPVEAQAAHDRMDIVDAVGYAHGKQ